MRPFLVVALDPRIEIGLKLGDRSIDLLAEDDAIELIEHHLVEALDDAIRLWALGLGAGVVDVLERQVELVFVVFRVAAIFRAAIGQHAGQLDLPRVIERHDVIVEEIGGGNRRLPIIELGEGDLGVGVDEGLLVDAPDPLHGADVERVLGAAIARAFALEFACASFSLLAFSSAASWLSVRTRPSWATLASRAFSRFFIVSRSWRCQTPRTPAGEIEWPSLRSSLAMRIWPYAGRSSESSTMIASTSGGGRFFRIGLRRVSSCSANSPPAS